MKLLTESRDVFPEITKWYVYTDGSPFLFRTVNVLDTLGEDTELEGIEEKDPEREREGVAEPTDELDSNSTGEINLENASVPPDEDLPLDVVFDILRNQRRRLVLSAIEERGGSTTLSDLAEHIGGIENSKPPHALNAQERKRVYVGLYQCHLPKMDDAGAIEFEQNRGTVERGPHAEVFHTYLDRNPEPESEWYRYYGLLAGIGCLGVTVSALFASSMLSIVATVSLFSVFFLTVIHAVSASDIEIRARSD